MTTAVSAAEVRVLGELRNLEQYLVELTSRLVQVHSVSPNLQKPEERGDGGEAAANRVVADAMASFGLRTEFVEIVPGRLNAIGILEGGGGGRSLGFNGHIDTVPAAVEQGWTRDPWSGV